MYSINLIKMDVITDLTSQALSYITLYQDLAKNKLFSPDINNSYVQSKLRRIKEIYTDNQPIVQKTMLAEEKQAADTLLYNRFIVRAEELYAWIESRGAAKRGTTLRMGNAADIPGVPMFWRGKIRALLFTDVVNRFLLLKILNYVPVQLILAMDGKNIKSYDRRYQVWDIAAPGETVPSIPLHKMVLGDGDTEVANIQKWWLTKIEDLRKGAIEVSKHDLAEVLLADDDLLRKYLKKHDVPLPFDSFFSVELKEIAGGRTMRKSANAKAPGCTDDPFRFAPQMDLKGLAISGGGIRSATFGLGVIQKLAALNQLNSFDYISTVSGGGYIGSWLVAWIQRNGSVGNISKCLDPSHSTDPMADEVRPIRWLRMYSNYLSPKASVMSADAWTAGITWLRNTLINQFILLFLLLSVLAAISGSFNLWRMFEHFNFWSATGIQMIPYGPRVIAFWSFVILLLPAIFAGSGMKNYIKRDGVNIRPRISGDAISVIMIIWSVIFGSITCSWFYTGINQVSSFGAAVGLLWPAAVVGAILMTAVAIAGRYFTQALECSLKHGFWGKAWIYFWIPFSSILSAAVGLATLAGVWVFFKGLPVNWAGVRGFGEKQVFILGTPLIVEVVSITIVVRMALMGLIFPDEKREWWGRMGGIIHRFALIWILITAGAIFVPDLIKVNFKNIPSWIGPAGATWATLVGIAVKMAFKSAGEAKKTDSSLSKLSDMFVRFAPYLFMVGFMLIGAYSLEALMNAFDISEGMPSFVLAGNFWIMSGALAVITWLVSWRTGVNEFSLHHFYRNRLTRAYLGATRSRDDRDNSADPFTGFDKNDDLRVADFRIEKGYYGPYPLLNTALNATDATELDRQDRMAESFIFSPLYCGYDFSATRSAINNRAGLFNYGYRQTEDYSTKGGPWLGSVVAMSGAAVSPNMGYHSSPATAFLLTMFNVRLGRWIGNPRQRWWKHSEPTAGIAYLVKDLIANTDINNNYVYLSDGGHFDNMGIYELVRRKCKYIVLIDGEQDTNGTCEGLANAIRRCRIDFGVEITIDTSLITQKDKDGFASEHAVTGTICYPGVAPDGKLVYVKTAVTTKLAESTDIREYKMSNPEFPQESTGDQFFNEAQFESYRKLGYLSIDIGML